MPRPLTPRATRHLAGLKRVAVPSTTLVEQHLVTLIPQVPAVWLDFHERYGGYVEAVSATENAVYGLMHSHPMWLSPMRCDFEDDPAEHNAYVACADVHPSYDHRLDLHGHFLAEPAESLEIQIERVALATEFADALQNAAKFYSSRDALSAQLAEELDQLLKQPPIPETSDQYAVFYRSEHLLVERCTDDDSLSIWGPE
jgi:hypothetical protein